MASTSILNKNLIARVKADYSHGVTTDDTRLSDRLVYSILLMCRNELLTQKSDKKQSLSNWNYQTLSGIELEPVNPAECLGISIGCPILRSKEELPTILSDKSGYMILIVSTIDGITVFSPINIRAVKFSSARKYTGNARQYFIQDGYLYVTGDTLLKVCAMTAVFADPLEADKFQNLCNDCKDCIDCTSNLDKEFVMDPGMHKVLVTLAVEELFNRFRIQPIDRRNDSREETTSQAT